MSRRRIIHATAATPADKKDGDGEGPMDCDEAVVITQ